MKKQRLDQLVVKHGLAESREKAQRLVRTGRVHVDGQIQTKPGHLFSEEAVLSVTQPDRFVSRGGEKMEGAFEAFPIQVQGLVCMDIGASTGGFTDCLLQHGALRVYAIDVGKGQLHWKLRNDERVVVMEKVNARYLTPKDLPESPAFAVVDVSFISLTKILPAVTQLLEMGGHIVSLIKPQFEAGRKQVGKGGVVREPAVHDAVIHRIREFGTKELGLEWLGLCTSPIKGPAGNVEFLATWRKK